MMRTGLVLFWLLIVTTSPFLAQDSNFKHSITEIEQTLKSRNWDIVGMSTIRRRGSGNAVYKAKKATLMLNDGTTMMVKWKTAPGGGEDFNNQPRYEIAAYKFQALFLEPTDYVVPPTLGLTLPIQQYRRIEADAIPTFDNTESVFFVVQYWLDNVRPDEIFDETRFESDSTYARHLSNMNIFSFLIKHNDSNLGNFLISSDPAKPKVFAVDNGVAFGRDASTRGSHWRQLRVKRLPKETVARLREITSEDLKKSLAVVAQFAVVNGQLIQIDPTPNLDKHSGVREKEGLIQFGLTADEIKGVYSRLQKLLKDVDSGKLQTF